MVPDVLSPDDALPSPGTLTHTLRQLLTARRLRLAIAESCTGGKLTNALCAEENTPDFFGIGYVIFTDAAKEKVLGVKPSTLERHTAVSEATAREMANGARQRSGEDIAIAVTGYGGPQGGEDGTPAGTVWFAWSFADRTEARVVRFNGDCEEVLNQAVSYALAGLIARLYD
ncbi:2-oxo-tetronate isomerase [Enterobacteriaceae bacterium 4M9]|nr:2-oxo-tetronate isomerase [Enterobacteriaceae bacterium 4M9]